MKQIISRTAIAAVFLVYTSAFAGTTTAQPVTKFVPMGAGLGPVDTITPAQAVSGKDRHLQSLAVDVRDGQGNELAGVKCTLSNDHGS
jgi:tripartite-type tricarboxylate transporter receptor subunit TctC